MKTACINDFADIYYSRNAHLPPGTSAIPTCGGAAYGSLPLEGKVWLGWLTIHSNMPDDDAKIPILTGRVISRAPLCLVGISPPGALRAWGRLV